NRAYPAAHIGARERDNAHAAFKAIINRGGGGSSSNTGTSTTSTSPLVVTTGGTTPWVELGPFTPTVPGEVTYTGRPTTPSGVGPSLAAGNNCTPGNCALFVGAAGGGVWKTMNAMDAAPTWAFISSDIPSTAIGSIVIDPTDPSGNTMYVGTGEPNGSS